MTPARAPDRDAFVFVGAFVDELARAGVHHVCIAPGSRSTPLALRIAEHPGLRAWVHVDERCAAFFAVGLARAGGAPVALLCTSGTAAANFLPAIVEAHSAGVPLVVLTADRPPELRDVGAPQTIDQNRLYGAHVKWFVEVASPEATPAMARYARTLAGRAVGAAMAVPAGPVHLNFPFREPLVPAPMEAPTDMSPADVLSWEGRPRGAPWVNVMSAVQEPDRAMIGRLADRLLAARRPLLVCGPQLDAALGAPLTALAKAIAAPLLADPLSQLRWGAYDRSTIIDRYDAVLREPAIADAYAPDIVVRLGGIATSKALLQFLERHAGAAHVVVDPGRWPDPTLLAAEMVRADPRVACERLLERMGAQPPADSARTAWLDAWRRLDQAAHAALTEFCASLGEPFEGRIVAETAALLPDGATLFVSNSMPVRDLDTFASGDRRAIRALGNRGANGIDGVVSTALGTAVARQEQGGGPLALIIGDLAFYHDMNGLLAAKQYALDATIVLLNNDGGGIFSFLPQAAHPRYFEKLFGTPHGLDFAPVARLYDATYCLAESSDALRKAVSTGLAGRGLHIVEMRTGRARNVELHAQARAAVSAALADLRAV